MVAAYVVWSEGNPLSAKWPNKAGCPGSTTNGRGSRCIAPAAATSTAAKARATPAVRPKATLSPTGKAHHNPNAATAISTGRTCAANTTIVYPGASMALMLREAR